MLKKAVTYTDYNGLERTEDFYFNLTRSELMELEASMDGGMHAYMESIVNSKDANKMMQFFKNIIRWSYGEKSPDGKRFKKMDKVKYDIADSFIESAAYQVIFDELLTKEGEIEKFMKGIIPADLQSAALPPRS